MTLDEAIEHAKEKAKELYDEAMFVHANPNDEKLDACIECASEHEQLAEWLTELKARREADRWIPVSERLPEREGEYLCTLHYAIPPYHIFCPEKDVYVDKVDVQHFDGTAFTSTVVAWYPKPLPEPYKENDK